MLRRTPFWTLTASLLAVTLSGRADAAVVIDWQNLGGALIGAPSAYNQGGGLEQVYARGTDNAAYARVSASSWGPWIGLGGSTASNATPVGAYRSVYLRFPDNRIYVRSNFTFPNLWSAWSLVPNSPPAATDPVPFEMSNTTYLVYVGTDNKIWTNYPGGSTWVNLSGFNIPISKLTVASDQTFNSSRIDVFLTAQNSIVYRATCTRGTWQYWWAEAGGFVGNPVSVRLNASLTFVVGRWAANNSLAYFTYDNLGRKSAVVNLGGYLIDDPVGAATVGNEAGAFEVFARGVSGLQQITAYDDGKFGHWQQLGGPVVSPLSVACDKPSRQCDVFGASANSNLWTIRVSPTP